MAGTAFAAAAFAVGVVDNAAAAFASAASVEESQVAGPGKDAAELAVSGSSPSGSTAAGTASTGAGTRRDETSRCVPGSAVRRPGKRRR